MKHPRCNKTSKETFPKIMRYQRRKMLHQQYYHQDFFGIRRRVWFWRQRSSCNFISEETEKITGKLHAVLQLSNQIDEITE